MAEVAEKPQTKKASKLLARYAELTQQKAELSDKYKADCAPLDAELADIKTKLEAWSNDNPGAFGDKKSVLLDGGTFGYRLGTKAIVFPVDAPGDIQAKYQALVKKVAPGALSMVVDSKKVLGALAHFPKLEEGMAKLGITVKQEEGFYITLKK